MEDANFVIHGDICWSVDACSIKAMHSAFLVCVDGKSAGVFARLPPGYAALPLIDCRGRLVTPGLADLHTHAPQFAFRGLGMDMELLDWLKTRAFPEEAKYSSLKYARKAYGLFIDHLKRGPNTRIVIYATVHVPATLALMDMLEDSGLVSMAGKVSMDRNCPDSLKEESAAASLGAAKKWLAAAKKYERTRPILTPRFIPSCSDDLMRGLGDLRRETSLPVQSHLSENQSEVAWVKELCPQSKNYSDAYLSFDLFGPETVMAHCVWLAQKEIDLMARRGVFAAHCPQSNANLSSGIAPVRRMLDAGVNLGLGSDIAGGANSSIFRAMADSIQVSKLRKTLHREAKAGSRSEKPITLEEAFYLGTKGGGAFFGKAGMGYPGSFEPGYDLDALVIDDGNLAAPEKLSIRDRLERVVYLSDDRNIEMKFVKGKKIKQELPGRT